MQLTIRSLVLSSAFALTFAFASPAMAGGAGGGGGGMATCVDATDTCQVCADEQCHDETQACCDATGCKDLVLCLLDNCADVLNAGQTALISCASQNCSSEISAAGGLFGAGTSAAQDVGTCIATPLQNPPAGACTDCVDGFGTGGGMGTGGMSTGGGSSTGGSTGSMGGAPGTGGAGTGGTTTGSGSGGADSGLDVEDDSGCGCRVVGSPIEDNAPWAVLLGLAGAVIARRRRR